MLRGDDDVRVGEAGVAAFAAQSPGDDRIYSRVEVPDEAVNIQDALAIE